MAYIGQEPGQGQAERFIFTASGSETVVSTADDGRVIGYTVGQVSVYLNGVKLVVGTDCIATNGSTITGLSALSASDVVEVIALSAFSPSDTVSASGGTFTGAVTASAGVIGNLTGNASGTAATVTTAAQPAITSVGTLTGFTSTGIDDNATSTAITIDASEQVGIGVVPSGTFTLKNGANVAYAGPVGYFDTNSAYSSAADRYIINGAATRLSLINGVQSFQVAPSGTAGNAISWTTAMTIDNSSIVTMPYQPAFSAYLSASQSIAGSTTTLVTLDVDEFDIGNNFNTSTNRFVAPVAGRYLFTAGLQFTASTTVTAHTNLYINGGTRTNGWFDFADSKASTQARVLDLAANDYVQLFTHSAPASTLSAERCKLTGFLIG